MNDLINDIIKENEKSKNEIDNILNINNNILINKEININNNNDALFNNYDIKSKELMLTIKVHKNIIFCSVLLNDGRFVTGSLDKSIIIYNKKTFKPDLIIKEHKYSVSYLLQLSSGLLASCSGDYTIKIFNINNNNYKIEQTLNEHKDWVNGIIELNNKKLISCSGDKSIIIYSKVNNKYKKDYKLNINDVCWNVIQTQENEICYSEGSYSIYFYDVINKKYIYKIENISIASNNCFNMITKDLLLILGKNILTIINVNQHKLIRKINVPNSDSIFSSCILNKNNILTGDYRGQIKHWRIEEDNLKLISIKEKAHNYKIFILLKLEDGHILSGSKEIKIW